MAGFLTCFLFRRLPIEKLNSDIWSPKERIETYSSGYCPGFPPDSLSEFPQGNSSPYFMAAKVQKKTCVL